MKGLTFAAIVLVILGCGNQPVESADQPITSTETDPQKMPQSPPKIGQPAPGFTLTDQSGRRVTLSEARGQKVVLLFYRGYW
jgi:cytochrome oxidase Cu insertion factor (SCO1/SenC/PrrC family)